MNPDITPYQKQIEALCETAGHQNGKLRPEQFREQFEGDEVDSARMLAILQYLNGKGIHLEIPLDPSPPAQGEAAAQPSHPGTPVPMTEKEKAYLAEYVKGLSAGGSDAGSGLTIWLEKAAMLAAEMNCMELPLADFLQESALAVLALMEQGLPENADPELIFGKIRNALEDVVQRAVKAKHGDDALVDKVTRFEKAVREANDTEGETFSAAELAILLDMDVEEIRAILRLTGDL